MKEEIIRILSAHFTTHIDNKELCAEEITQMICDKIYDLLFEKSKSAFDLVTFKMVISNFLDKESSTTGFTEDQIKLSLEKLK
jgi:hypothetical protein